MTYFQAVVLGIIQGASEFLPISSSGHLVLAPELFGWSFDPREAFVFDVLVQVATLSAVLIYYWQDLLEIARAFFAGLRDRRPFDNPASRLAWFLLLATIPAGLLAVLFKETFEKAFSSPRAAAWFLLVTSLLLVIGELLGRRERILNDISWVDALVVGLFQALALFPGVSRSGSTISGGLVRGLKRPDSARLAFLMAVPVMAAAGVLALADLLNSPMLLSNLPVYLAGFGAAAVVGYLAIRWFISYLTRQSLYIFALYCFVVGFLFLVL